MVGRMGITPAVIMAEHVGTTAGQCSLVRVNWDENREETVRYERYDRNPVWGTNLQLRLMYLG